MQDDTESTPHSQNSPKQDPPLGRIGQVCDRCRIKRVKCNGATPSCAACSAAGVACEVSATLRRKTKIRGFPSSEDARLISSLRSENSELREKLQAECETTKALREELERLTLQSQSRPHKLLRSRPPPSTQLQASPSYPTSSEPDVLLADRSVYVIKHMGRLVYDESGTGRFAGSTTGVHFVLKVQEACIQSLNYTTQFPQSCYSLYLLQPTISLDVPLVSDCGTDIGLSSYATLIDDIRQCLSFPLNYFIRQIDIFVEQWESFCPILVRREIVKDLQTLFTKLHAPSSLSTVDYATVEIVLMVLVINQLDECLGDTKGYDNTEIRRKYVDVAHRISNQVAAHADLKALQALILFAFYLQLTGQSIGLLQLNGQMVRIAQSIGLHRHDRRFKYKSGLVELRRRIWWWIYLFDKITSIVHGLPRLLNEGDIESDMPADCILEDINAEYMSYPLPGENTPIFLFNQYILLGKKLSVILEQLYTTTQRRGGAEKITRLDRDLRVWNHTFNALPHVTPFEIGEYSRHVSEEGEDSGHAVMMSWLQLLANISMLLVHWPALTFSGDTPEFATSLRTCVRSSTVIIDTLDDRDLGLWLRSICPSAPRMVFQSALMNIYCHCSPIVSSRVGLPDRTSSISVVAKAIQILKSYVPETAEPSSNLYNPADLRSQWIGDAVSTLHSLEMALTTGSHTQSIPVADLNLGTGPQALQLAPSIEPQQATTNIDAWNTNALESLNNFNNFDWIWGEITSFTPVT